MNGNNRVSAVESMDGTTEKLSVPNLVLYFLSVLLLLLGVMWVFFNVFWPNMTPETGAIMFFVGVTTAVSITALEPLACVRKVQK